MPLAAAAHGHTRIEAFLWGLLPDNEFVLDRWAKRFHVSARSAFALLSHVGEDCAGAVQFVPTRPRHEDVSNEVVARLTATPSGSPWILEISFGLKGARPGFVGHSDHPIKI